MQSTYLLDEEFAALQDHKLYTKCLMPLKPRSDNLTAIIMHGAGEADSSRHTDLAEQLADEGIKVVLLDFVGHGKTGGAMSESSLNLRIDHAYEIIKRYTDDNAPLILCGFSMSGHVALRLLPKLGSRVQNLGLFCPAVYAAEAEDVHFGPEFTKILRTPESWRSSIALQNAARYKNRALLVIGSNDQTIPWRVVEAITASLKQSASHVQLEVIGGADHQLAKWLSDHPKTSMQISQYLGQDKV